MIRKNRVTFRVTCDMPTHLTKQSLKHWMETVIRAYRPSSDPFVTVQQVDPIEEKEDGQS